MKAYENIDFELKESTATIWLNRPDKHNAMNAEMIAETRGRNAKINEEKKSGKDIVKTDNLPKVDTSDDGVAPAEDETDYATRLEKRLNAKKSIFN